MAYWFSTASLGSGNAISTSAAPQSLPSTPTGKEVVSYQQPPQALVSRLQALVIGIIAGLQSKIGSSYEDAAFWMSD